MTVMPMFKICPKCRGRFLWNPDVMNVKCPYCGMIVLPGNVGIVQRIMIDKKRRKNGNNTNGT